MATVNVKCASKHIDDEWLLEMHFRMLKGALSHFRILLSILLIILNNLSYSSFGC